MPVMQLVADGPDIPDELRRALDDGRLVLFCGAGVSMAEEPGGPGMPTFGGLVKDVYRHIQDTMQDDERAAFDAGAHDRVLHLLEVRVGRTQIRRAVHAILTVGAPHGRHRSLLELAGLDGGVRLVTTNFDGQFERAATEAGIAHTSHVAPLLPVPKAHRWKSAVYLHGRIPLGAGPGDPAMDDLVFTSGDFGLAYLTERWAARFVTELFTEYVVLFVGYSLEDPVMRYLMDAFAADRDRSGQPSTLPRAWAFAETAGPGDVAKQVARWRSKGVMPIPYTVGGGHDHSLLYRSLAEWARRRRHGLDANLKLAGEAAAFTPAPPYFGAQYDSARWALEDPAALRTFAEAPVAPPIEWLPVLEGWGFLEGKASGGNGAGLAGCMPGTEATSLGGGTYLLGRWLTRHLDRPEFLDWVLGKGMPHPEFQRLVTDRLAMPVAAAGSPPGPGERQALDDGLVRAWKLIASPVSRAGRLLPSDVPGHVDGLAAASADPAVREDLLRRLAPVLRLRSSVPYRAFQGLQRAGAGEREPTIRDYVEADVELAAGQMGTVLRDALGRDPRRDNVLTAMADELTTLLKRCLDLFALGGQAGADGDPSLFGRAAIVPHDQDRHRDGWTLLIDFARDAMAALRVSCPEHAAALLARWKSFPYPLFRRMILDDRTAMACPASEALAELLAGDTLWDVRLRPESLFLAARLWRDLDEAGAAALVAAVLRGPPPSGRPDEAARRDRDIGLRLMVLEAEGGPLPPDAAAALEGIRARSPGATLSAERREFFPVWFTSGSPGQAAASATDILSLNAGELEGWLRASAEGDGRGLDDWREVVEAKPGRGVAALHSFAAKGEWPAPIWRETLQSLGKSPRKTQTFRRLAPLLTSAPEGFLQDSDVGWAVAWWLADVARILPMAEEPRFWQLWDHLAPRLIVPGHVDAADRDPLTAALNQAPGRMAEAVLSRFFEHRPAMGGGLPAPVGPRMTMIADAEGDAFRVARVMFARSLPSLFANDAPWAREHLLRRLRWTDPVEAASMWRGFLAGGRFDPGVFGAVKADFLETLSGHAGEVYESEGILWQLLMVAGLEMPGTMAPGEAREALRNGSVSGRREAARYLSHLMPADCPGQGASLWTERVGPWLAAEWPKDKQLRDPEASGALALATVAAGDAFPAACAAILGLMVPGAGEYRLWHALLATELPERFPRDVFGLVTATLSADAPHWALLDLPKLLDRIAAADAAFAGVVAFKNLRERLARSGLAG